MLSHSDLPALLAQAIAQLSITVVLAWLLAIPLIADFPHMMRSCYIIALGWIVLSVPMFAAQAPTSLNNLFPEGQWLELKDASNAVAVLHRPVVRTPLKGTIIFLATHPKAVIQAAFLHRILPKLAQQHWSTLGIFEIPSEKVKPQHWLKTLESGLAALAEKNTGPVFLLVYDSTAGQLVKELAILPKNIQGVVLISALSPPVSAPAQQSSSKEQKEPAKKPTTVEAFSLPRIALLEIVGSRDYQQVLQQYEQRKRIGATAAGYYSHMILGAKHDYLHYETLVASHIHSFCSRQSK